MVEIIRGIYVFCKMNLQNFQPSHLGMNEIVLECHPTHTCCIEYCWIHKIYFIYLHNVFLMFQGREERLKEAAASSAVQRSRRTKKSCSRRVGSSLRWTSSGACGGWPQKYFSHGGFRFFFSFWSCRDVQVRNTRQRISSIPSMIRKSKEWTISW